MNKQIVFTKPNTAELTCVETRSPSADEVMVELEYSAISPGTERANIIGERNNVSQKEGEKAVFPRSSGYSSSGKIVKLGENVTNFKIGDRVVCYWGKHQKFLTVSKRNVVKIPDDVDMKQAAFAFISTFPLAAIRKTKLEIGESAIVMGLGTLGILAVAQLRAAGAYPVIAVDPIEEKRKMALDMGADYALDPLDEDFYVKVKSLTDGGANVCIEVTGIGAGLIQALDCLKRYGRVSLLGCTRNSNFSIDYYSKVHAKAITIVGAHTIARPEYESSPGYWTHIDDIKAVFSLLKGKRLDYSKMICEIHSPKDCQEVYTRLVKEKTFPVGVLFDWNKID